ncbi:MAG: crossover junction endodeoxyribonuclease RuvC [Pseudomonadota bacterium]
MRIIGIDPGLNRTGWGVIACDGPRLRHVANGTIKPTGGDLAQRLVSLFDGLSEVFEFHTPTDAAVELTFVNSNGAASLKLGQARGIAMLVPARAGVSVGEYAPNAIKKTVVGAGHADKHQIEHMVKLHLPGSNPAGADAADALAIAICHAHHAQSGARYAAALAKAGA